MSDMLSFGLFILVSFGTMMVLVGGGTLIANSYTDGRSAARCETYGETSGLEVKAEKSYCFINDPEYGWITYQERKEQRFAERGMKYE